MITPTVLMWHAFGDREDTTDPYRLFVPEKVFAQQLDLLAERGSHFLELEEFMAGLETGRWRPRSVLITIDDGYVSTLDVAAPLLAARAVPAVAFVLAGRLGGSSDWMHEMSTEPLLGADGLVELERHGVRVESHGWDHRLLRGLSPPELHRQVATSRTALSDVLGREPVAFAYPSGAHDLPARRAVKEAGYRCAFSVHHCTKDRFALRRVDINPTDTKLTFRLKVTRLWPAIYQTLGRVGPIRRGVHRLFGSNR